MISARHMLKVQTNPDFQKSQHENLQRDITQDSRGFGDPKQIFGFDFQSSQDPDILEASPFAQDLPHATLVFNSKQSIIKSSSQRNLCAQSSILNNNSKAGVLLTSQLRKHELQRNNTFTHQYLNKQKIQELENLDDTIQSVNVKTCLSSTDQSYLIGTELNNQSFVSSNEDDSEAYQVSDKSLLRQTSEVANHAINVTVPEQMLGVTGLMSLSVKLGDVCNLSTLARGENIYQYGRKESPTVRAISSRIQEPERKLIQGISRGLKAQQEVYVNKEGLGGTYFFRNERGDFVAIVKPIDEEPLAPNNPKGYIGRQLGDPGWKSSIRVGEAAVREWIAYLLDTNNAAKVPTTVLANIKHEAFNYNNLNGNNQFCLKSKISSVQKFVASEGDCSDVGYGQFSKIDVQRIGLLDIRIFNTDRHSGNLLYRKSKKLSQGNSSQVRQAMISGDYNYQLIPIDHGFCLPESLECPYFEWLYWPQPSLPLDPELKQSVLDMDIERDIDMIQMQIPHQILRRGMLRMYQFSATFLKICVKAGLNLFEIGKLMSESNEVDMGYIGVDEDQEPLEDVTELIKCANAAINQMYEDEFNGDETESDCLSVGNLDGEYSNNLRPSKSHSLIQQPRYCSQSQVVSAPSLRSQGSKVGRMATFTLPEDRQLDFDDLGFEVETQIHPEFRFLQSNNCHDSRISDNSSAGKGMTNFIASQSSAFTNLAETDILTDCPETPKNKNKIHFAEQSPFQITNTQTAPDRDGHIYIQESPPITPGKFLDFQTQQEGAKSLAQMEPYYFDQAMRNRSAVNSGRQMYTLPQKHNLNKVQPRFKHLYSNYVKNHKAQPLNETICFENFSDSEFSTFMRVFKEVLQVNLAKGMYRENQGIEVSRFAQSVPY